MAYLAPPLEPAFETDDGVVELAGLGELHVEAFEFLGDPDRGIVLPGTAASAPGPELGGNLAAAPELAVMGVAVAAGVAGVVTSGDLAEFFLVAPYLGDNLAVVLKLVEMLFAIFLNISACASRGFASVGMRCALPSQA